MCKGQLIEKKVNYMVDLEDTIIIIKGVPAKVCTQCGEQYFDDKTSEKRTFFKGKETSAKAAKIA